MRVVAPRIRVVAFVVDIATKALCILRSANGSNRHLVRIEEALEKLDIRDIADRIRNGGTDRQSQR